MKPESHESPEARNFGAKKPLAKETPKATPKRKHGKTSKGQRLCFAAPLPFVSVTWRLRHRSIMGQRPGGLT